MQIFKIPGLSPKHFQETRDAKRVLEGVCAVARQSRADAVTAKLIEIVKGSQRLQIALCQTPDLSQNQLLRDRVILRLTETAELALDIEPIFEDRAEYTNLILSKGERVKGMFPAKTEPEINALKANLERRGFSDLSIVDKYAETLKEIAGQEATVAVLKQARKKVKGRPSSEELEGMKQVSEKIKALEFEVDYLKYKMAETAIFFPNWIDSSVPRGGEDKNKVVKQWGKLPGFDSYPKDHVVIGEALGILNFKKAGELSGNRFVIGQGRGAQLERALISFMLDLHTKEHGFTEIWPPSLVRAETMMGTGQLPGFRKELYKSDQDDLFLVPTAEVPLTNLRAGEIIGEEELPIYVTAFTPCFRREAGAYGKDIKGMIRQHQFSKVELVKLVHPATSFGELESLTRSAEIILERLGLPYQRVLLAGADTGTASTKTYDLEVWLPGQGKYREISSCSNCLDYQSRRMGTRFRGEEGGTKYIHTLNGSGLAVGRTLIAILENYQTGDGHVVIPEALRPYMDGIDRI